MLPARWLSALQTRDSTRVEPSGEALSEARRRIRVAALLGLGSYTLFLAVELSDVMHASALEHRIDVTHDMIGVGFCALLLGAAWLRPLGDRAVIRCGIAFELAVCALISVMVPWAAWVRTGHLSSLTWVVPIVIGFALLLPGSPAVVWGVSAACASFMPLGSLLLSRLGLVHVTAGDYWASFLSMGVSVGMAGVAAHTVYGARRQLTAVRRFGSYELQAQLGGGGMGEVWRASHLLLARPAAVKLIAGEWNASAGAQRQAIVERFTREAQVTARLRSPHTVELYDFGVSADGVMYYAMELLDGINLEHFIYRHGPVPARRAVHWLRQVCHSLGEAHALGLTHRDIKPANLMVCVHGREHDFVKVLDFGLAHAVSSPGAVPLTREGRWLGTPGWMAPEQIYGSDGGPRADLYALGCVGYWLLAGRRPFEAETAAELFRLHLHAAAPPLAERAAEPVPGALERAILACLAKEPDQRPRDADELNERLAASLPGEPWTQSEARECWAREATAR